MGYELKLLTYRFVSMYSKLTNNYKITRCVCIHEVKLCMIIIMVELRGTDVFGEMGANVQKKFPIPMSSIRFSKQNPKKMKTTKKN